MAFFRREIERRGRAFGDHATRQRDFSRREKLVVAQSPVDRLVINFHIGEERQQRSVLCRNMRTQCLEFGADAATLAVRSARSVSGITIPAGGRRFRRWRRRLRR